MPSHQPSHLKAIVAANLSVARAASGLTLREVAARLGEPVTPDQVWRWEDGRHLPSAANQQALADLFFDGDVAALYINHKVGERVA